MPEAVIVSTARTPIGRANKGSLVECRPDDLTAHIVKAALAKVPALDPQTVEDLIKSAEWYEKRAQTQTQSAAERVSEQAGNQLREKAGNLASEFGSELDQSSRNFVTYAQTQMAEVVSEAFERARGLFAEAAETTPQTTTTQAIHTRAPSLSSSRFEGT